LLAIAVTVPSPAVACWKDGQFIEALSNLEELRKCARGRIERAIDGWTSDVLPSGVDDNLREPKNQLRRTFGSQALDPAIDGIDNFGEGPSALDSRRVLSDTFETTSEGARKQLDRVNPFSDFINGVKRTEKRAEALYGRAQRLGGRLDDALRPEPSSGSDSGYSAPRATESRIGYESIPSTAGLSRTPQEQAYLSEGGRWPREGQTQRAYEQTLATPNAGRNPTPGEPRKRADSNPFRRIDPETGVPIDPATGLPEPRPPSPFREIDPETDRPIELGSLYDADTQQQRRLALGAESMPELGDDFLARRTPELRESADMLHERTAWRAAQADSATAWALNEGAQVFMAQLDRLDAMIVESRDRKKRQRLQRKKEELANYDPCSDPRILQKDITADGSCTYLGPCSWDLALEEPGGLYPTYAGCAPGRGGEATFEFDGKGSGTIAPIPRNP